MYAKISLGADGVGTLESTEAFDKPGPGLARWYGGVKVGRLTWGDEPVNVGASVLPLPEPAAGCRDIHRPLLDLFRRELGGGVPLDSLADEWEIVDDERPVIEVEIVYSFDEETGGSFRVDVIGDVGDEERARVVEAVNAEEWADVDEYTEDNDGDVIVTLYVALSNDGEVIGVHEFEYNAGDAVRERREESRYGHPWAHSWAYYVDGHYLVDDLQAAGFVVAEQTDTGHLFCGVDGGGYDFQSAHHVVLAALRLARYGGKVEAPLCASDREVPERVCIPVGPLR